MGVRLQMGMLLSLCMIYGTLVMFLWDDRALAFRPRSFGCSNNITIESTTGTVYVDGYMEHTAVHRPTSMSRSTLNSDEDHYHQTCLQKIQFWYYLPRPELEQGFYYCPETDCTVQYILESSYELVETSDVVVLHHLGDWDLERINRVRRGEQIIVYMSRESPPASRKLSKLSPFNWTITYNSRSEVTIPYGSLIRNSPVETREATKRLRTKNWAHGKTGLAIWIVSNCKRARWPRLSYGAALARFMRIDVFGRCGEQKCGDKEACLRRIYSYKFYIAFENTLCEEYITEKMWRNALQYDAVPIVYGAPKSDYERLAPKDSFIHVSDFSNMSSLAAYINLLDMNDTLYNRYFEWKLDYRVEQLGAAEVVRFETLCSISKRLVKLKGSNDRSHCNVDWFKKSCSKVSIPEMI